MALTNGDPRQTTFSGRGDDVAAWLRARAVADNVSFRMIAEGIGRQVGVPAKPLDPEGQSVRSRPKKLSAIDDDALPVIQLAAGEARNSTTPATSSSRPTRPNGTYASVASYNSELPLRLWSQLPSGNSIDAGSTQFTRIPWAASILAWLALE